MSNRRCRGSVKPTGTRRFERVEVIWEPIRGIHQGQRKEPREKAGHMDALLPIEHRDFLFAPEGPSTHGPQNPDTLPSVPPTSARTDSVAGKRKNFSAAFKAKVALMAIRGEMTVAERLCQVADRPTTR